MKNQPVIIVKKKRGGHGAHHGGAWKVAYADFVTALMAFFLVMWLVGQSAQVRAAVAGYFRNPGLFEYEKSNSMVPGGEKGILPEKEGSLENMAAGATLRDAQLLEQAASRIRQALGGVPEFRNLKDQIEIKLTNEGLLIELQETAATGFFDTGSAKINEAGEHILVAIARELSQVPNGVLFEGHTDSRPYQSTVGYTNWELSSDRANAARRTMERSGLQPAQVRGVRGWADTQLRTPNDPYDAKNRRVTIIVQNNRPPKP
jgi:chemotaxis protein MotB